MSYDIMLVLKSKEGLPFAIYAKGHYMGDIRVQTMGDFHFHRNIKLPEMLTNGLIYVDLFLHKPGVEYQMKAPDCCILESEGYVKGFGHAIIQSNGGFECLNDEEDSTC